MSFTFAAIAAEQITEIKWVLAHEPARVFRRAAEHFAKSLEGDTKHKIKVTIVEATSTGQNSAISPEMAIQMVKSGEIQMSQTYTTLLGTMNKEMWVLDLPYLFRSHEHAASVLDGAIGKKILAGLETSGLKGLGFTYSGGFRIIPSKDSPLLKAEDFVGKKIRVIKESPIAAAFMKELGAIPLQVENEEYASGIDAFETTYARLGNIKNDHSKFINQTEHSLFLTAIIINKDFFEKLPQDMQQSIAKAALEASVLERKDSIEDNLISKKKYLQAGIKITEMPLVEKQKMQVAGKKVTAQYADFFQSGLIADIQKAK